jgi:hypothetical protein
MSASALLPPPPSPLALDLASTALAAHPDLLPRGSPTAALLAALATDLEGVRRRDDEAVMAALRLALHLAEIAGAGAGSDAALATAAQTLALDAPGEARGEELALAVYASATVPPGAESGAGEEGSADAPPPLAPSIALAPYALAAAAALGPEAGAAADARADRVGAEAAAADVADAVMAAARAGAEAAARRATRAGRGAPFALLAAFAPSPAAAAARLPALPPQLERVGECAAAVGALGDARAVSDALRRAVRAAIGAEARAWRALVSVLARLVLPLAGARREGRVAALAMQVLTRALALGRMTECGGEGGGEEGGGGGGGFVTDGAEGAAAGGAGAPATAAASAAAASPHVSARRLLALPAWDIPCPRVTLDGALVAALLALPTFTDARARHRAHEGAQRLSSSEAATTAPLALAVPGAAE